MQDLNFDADLSCWCSKKHDVLNLRLKKKIIIDLCLIKFIFNLTDI